MKRIDLYTLLFFVLVLVACGNSNDEPDVTAPTVNVAPDKLMMGSLRFYRLPQSGNGRLFVMTPVRNGLVVRCPVPLPHRAL